MYFGRTSATITAMAAIDIAVWNLKGKRSASRSIACWAASSTTAIKAYASILFGRDGKETDRSPLAREPVTAP